ncbi:cytochrome c family protein [Candidatus Vesicomyidisocius sp. SY067_SCS001]|uniref:cytochrome c family protein n=1 Tax=Candidatus Vesicomyidisocius sp. SY067_SCS001 TaxID=2732590 RepID=UPI00168A0A7F|nr:cytochrome c family protein [Candidatus Vesicomyosocius sp. SY067_SCS001]
MQNKLIYLIISFLGLQVQADLQSFVNSKTNIIIPSTKIDNISYSNIDNLSSKECSVCHYNIYKQWTNSMHAKSTALKDPIHGLFYGMVVGSPKVEGIKTGNDKDKYPVCLECHSPAAAKEKKTKLNAKNSFSEGVNCIACHSLTKYKRIKNQNDRVKLGIKAYKYSSHQIQGPNGTNKKHKRFGEGGVANNPGLFKTSKACLGCHNQRNNSKKVPLCQTGGEIISAGGSTTCQSCHMPVIEGISNHTMIGGHSVEMVSKGLVMTINAKEASNMLYISVNATNLLPHNFPTGAPFRNFYITVTAQDYNDNILWQSSKTHPMIDDKKAMFMYIIGNDNNKTTSPSKATKILGDTRLKPNETRILNYKIPSNDVSIVTAKAYYDLLLVPMKNKFSSKLPKHLLDSKEIAKAIIIIR